MQRNLPELHGRQNPQKRLESLKAMLSASDPQAHEILLACLIDKASIIRSFAAVQLVTLYDAKYIRQLIPLLADDGLVSQNLIRALQSTKQDISQPLLEAVNSGDPLIRAGCAAILRVYPSAHVVDMLIELLEDQDVRVRLNAASSLGWTKDQRAVPALLQAMDDRSDIVGQAAIMALGYLNDQTVVEILVRRLSTEDKSLRKQGILYALGELGNAQAAQPLLDVFLRPQETELMRDSAAMALTFLGDEGKEALQTALVEGDAFAQQFAKAYLRL